MEDNKGIYLGAIVGAVIGAGAVIAYNKIGTNKNINKEVERSVVVGESEDTLAEEQFKRNIQFLGEESFAKLANSKIVIVGLGGTGSHAAHLLARSGAGFIRMIDFDQVSLSSLNRHAVATRADVGKPKVDVMRDHLLKTVPACICECVRDIFSLDNGRRLLFSSNPTDLNSDLDFKPDFVVDCIDNVETKAFLLSLCHQENIPVITSCGAGCRLDPTKFTICDISEAVGDPLLRSTKVILSKKYKIKRGIPCLYSTEKPPRKLLPFAEEDEDPSDYQTLPEIHMRVRIVPVLGPMPAIWGNALSMYVINTICGLNFSPQPIETRGRKFWDSLLNRVRQTEKNFCQKSGKEVGTLNKDCISFLLEEIWDFQSVYSGRVSPTKGGITLVRWDTEKPLSILNAIPLATTEVEDYYSGKLQFTKEQNTAIENSFKILQ